jgi:hypothetical protein
MFLMQRSANSAWTLEFQHGSESALRAISPSPSRTFSSFTFNEAPHSYLILVLLFLLSHVNTLSSSLSGFSFERPLKQLECELLQQ